MLQIKQKEGSTDTRASYIGPAPWIECPPPGVAGHAALMLHLPSKPSWGELPEEITSQAIGTLLLKHASGLHLFAAPPIPPSLQFTLEKFNDVVRIVDTFFEEVVVNCSPSITPTSQASLTRANRIILVLAPEITTVQTALGTLAFMQSLNIPNERIRIVVNQPAPNLSLATANIEKALGRAVDVSLPFEPLQTQALAQGIPLAFSATGTLPPYIMGLALLLQKL